MAPLTYEIFDGNSIDSTTLKHIVETVDTKHGKARRVWVFDRGITTEENLKWLRERGACYLVGTPKPQLNAFEQHLTDKDWQKESREVEVKLCPNDDVYVLARSQGRVRKEQAMRRRVLKACVRDLIKLRRSVARGSIKDSKLIDRRIAHLEEHHRPMWRFLKHCRYDETNKRIQWEWNREKWQAAVNRDGAYLLRAHWPGQHSAAELWQTYLQLTEAEAAFRTMKSEIKVRPIWHQLGHRVEALIMVAFLGYAMHVCLKKLAARKAPSLTSWQVLQHLRKIVLVDVEFDTADGRAITLPKITPPRKNKPPCCCSPAGHCPSNHPRASISVKFPARSSRDLAKDVWPTWAINRAACPSVCKLRPSIVRNLGWGRGLGSIASMSCLGPVGVRCSLMMWRRKPCGGNSGR